MLHMNATRHGDRDAQYSRMFALMSDFFFVYAMVLNDEIKIIVKNSCIVERKKKCKLSDLTVLLIFN